MLTFGLNRPLFSFGLSYPGYFFVIIQPPEEGAGPITFKVVEPNRFKAYELVKFFKAQFGNAFIAVATEEDKLGRYFFIFAEDNTHPVADIVRYFAKETGNKFDAEEFLKTYYPQEEKSYIANDIKIFKASQAVIYGGEQ